MGPFGPMILKEGKLMVAHGNVCNCSQHTVPGPSSLRPILLQRKMHQKKPDAGIHEAPPHADKDRTDLSSLDQVRSIELESERHQSLQMPRASKVRQLSSEPGTSGQAASSLCKRKASSEPGTSGQAANSLCTRQVSSEP